MVIRNEDLDDVLGHAGQHPYRLSVDTKGLGSQDIWNNRDVKFVSEIVTGCHRTAGNIYCIHTQPAGAPLWVPGGMIRLA